MKRKKYLVNATLGFLAFITLLVSAISVNRSHSSSTRGEFSPYSIVLGTEKNKIAEGSENPDGYTGNRSAYNRTRQQYCCFLQAFNKPFDSLAKN